MDPEKLYILLAEDDQDDRLFFKKVFDSLKIKHTLDMCEDGDELMAYLDDSNILPHIIFLDVNMPGRSGMECLKAIRSSTKLRETTVAMYSSLSSRETIEDAFISGANVFIKKPNEFDELRKILKEVMYINWQYVTDGMNRENYMINYYNT
ncbi:response regulator [Flavobacterium sp. DG1-102-2]|uniref:response regulator n=1 Tax=Flavobacterium sp. DG1-102-2 TaxID=3081663 RepID=UPI002949B368|nr:response regulator [Flavobacterium sp. DG1-102-2]MDV6167201.1 response regulator [Flavobacterium sp. DG1-102-2]